MMPYLFRGIHPFLDKLLNHVRTFLYLGLFLAWGISVSRRVVIARTRRILIPVASLMMFWILLRAYKWHLVIDPDVLRHLWYMYYIPFMLIPMLALMVAVSLGKAEQEALPIRVKLCLGFTILLILLILTNDLHQLVFSFPADARIRSEDDFHYEIVYFIAVAWMAFCACSAQIVLILRTRNRYASRQIVLPLLLFAVTIAYSVLYALHVSAILSVLNDFAVIWCLVFSAFFELCIRSGMIPSNRYYDILFRDFGMINMQITDRELRVCYASRDARTLSEREIRSAMAGPCILSDKTRLHCMPVDGGYAFWTEDLAEFLTLHETLLERREEWQERNALLQFEYEKEKAHVAIEQRNHLYDILQRIEQPRLDRIEQLVQQYRAAGDKEEKYRILTRIVILGSYIKRRKDFVLSMEYSHMLSAEMLTNALAESYRALALAGIRGSSYVEIGRQQYPGETLARAYDFFEEVTELVFDRVSFLNVSVSRIEGQLRIRIMTDCETDPTALLFHYANAKMIMEDGMTFVLALGGGESS